MWGRRKHLGPLCDICGDQTFRPELYDRPGEYWVCWRHDARPAPRDSSGDLWRLVLTAIWAVPIILFAAVWTLR
jgi:hypothetical protein